MKFLLTLLLLCCSTPVFSQWEKVDVPWDGNLYLDVFFLPTNAQFGWICGMGGRVLRTTDGGDTWQGTQIATAGHLESVHFVSTSVGYVTGPTDQIFKSVDGGVSWTDVTPAGASALWGCYFLNANEGYVFGGTCNAFGDQRYWRTTDGGATWTDTVTAIPSSKLSDGIVYPTGVGYAVGSGELFRTLDSGFSWQWFADIGQNVWSEEITNVGSSFLVPLSGSDCDGQSGPNGGMRFSTNNGSSWTSFVTPSHNYGAFLESSTSGWVCGLDGQVYYTNDAGQNWQLRNCGLEDDDLDDIWFSGPNTGWVVGTGVYKFVWPPYKADTNLLSFGEICLPGPHIDTVWIHNRDSEQATWNASVIGSNFSVVAPSSGTLDGCDSVAVLISCTPTIGFSEADLRVTMNGSTSLDIWVDLFAVGRANTLTLDETSVQDTIDVGVGYIFGLQVYTELSFNAVTEIAFSSADWLEVKTSLPTNVDTDSAELEFEVVLQDTGWYSTDINVLSEPCEGETTATVSFYGLSPIVVVSDSVVLSLGCGNASTLYIPFENTGNDTLVVENLTLQGTDAGEFGLLGWVGSGVIVPQGRDTLIVDISNVTAGQKDVRIVCNTNDRTTTRGDKTTVVIELIVSSSKPEFTFTPMQPNIPELCVGQTHVVGIGTLVGDDVLQGEMTVSVTDDDRLRLITPNISPSPVLPGASVGIQVELAPQSSGVYSDTVRMVISPCDTVFEVVLSYEVTGFDIAIADYSDTVFVGDITSHTTSIVSLENNPILIDNAVVSEPGIDVSLSETTIKALDSVPMSVQAQLLDTGWHDIQVQFAVQPCDGRDSGTIRLYGLSPIIEAPNQVVFSNSPCDTVLSTQFAIANTGNYTLTIASVSLMGSDAAFCQVSETGPFEIAPNDQQVLTVTGQDIPIPLDCYLLIEHSDTRRAVSPSSPLHVDIVAANGVADLRLVNDIVSLGALCPGEVTTQTITLINRGDGVGEFTIVDAIDGLTVDQINGTPGLVDVAESVQLLLTYSSVQPGTIDSELVIELPCGETLIVRLRGEVLDERFAVVPSSIDQTVSSLAPATIPIDISNIGASDVFIASVTFEPVTPGITLAVAPTLLSSSETLRALLEVDISVETTITGIVIVESQGVCPAIDTIPVTLRLSDVAYELSATALDFGRLPCRDTVWSLPLSITNLGTEDIKELQAYALSTTSLFTISPESIDVLPVAGTEQFLVTFDGARALPGIYEERFVIESSNKSVQDTIDVVAEVYTPTVGVTSPYAAGYAEFGETTTLYIEVSSDGQVPVYVTCATCDSSWDIPERHDVVNSSTSQYLPLRFTPTTSGTHTIVLDVVFGDLCEQRSEVELTVQVPYDITFIAEDHAIEVGGQYELPILVRGDMAQIEPGSIEMSMSMHTNSIAVRTFSSADRQLFYNAEPEFSVTDDGYQLVFDPNEFGQHQVVDTALVVDFLGLASRNEVHDWRFGNAFYTGPDSVRIATQNGRHLFAGMCIPLYGVLSGIDSLQISVLGNGSTKPFLMVDTKKSENISIIVHDNLGRVVKGMHDIQTSQGMNEFDITNDLASGTYFIEVRHLWLTYTQTLHVVK